MAHPRIPTTTFGHGPLRRHIRAGESCSPKRSSYAPTPDPRAKSSSQVGIPLTGQFITTSAGTSRLQYDEVPNTVHEDRDDEPLL